FTVTHTVDLPDLVPGDGQCAAAFGACTLRAALQEANADSVIDTIVLGAGTYRLTRTSGPNDASFGDLDVLQSVEIVGAGMRDTLISASTGERVLEIQGGSANLRALTLRDGRAAGGGGVRVDGGAALLCASCLI